MRDTFVDVDLENEDLLIKSDAAQGSMKEISVLIYDKTSDVNIAAIFMTYDVIGTGYHVGKCTEPGTRTRFSALPAENNKIWRISEKSGSLDILCNEIEVVEYEFSTSNNQGNLCVIQWSLDAARIKFQTTDSASNSYSIARRNNHGK